MDNSTSEREYMLPPYVFKDIRSQFTLDISFITVSGSHVYGYASPFSDYDIHMMHVLPLNNVIGFESRRDETIDTKITWGEWNIDVVSHDIKKFILLLIKGNGNVLEDLYSPQVGISSALHEELKEWGKGCITKMCAAHYNGMAYNQQRRMQINDVKKLLHTYRCLLMGIHLMRTGEMLMDVPQLAEIYQMPLLQRVIKYKLSGVEGLEKSEMAAHDLVLFGLHKMLDIAVEQSHLPKETPEKTRKELEALLIRVRRGAI